jgi:hypothetical protein
MVKLHACFVVDTMHGSIECLIGTGMWLHGGLNNFSHEQGFCQQFVAASKAITHPPNF